jgi:hypothetical protein
MFERMFLAREVGEEDVELEFSPPIFFDLERRDLLDWCTFLSAADSKQVIP